MARHTSTLDPLELAYIAGLFDGEGNICAQGARQKHYSRNISVVIGMTNQDVLLWIHSKILNSRFYTYSEPKEGHQQVYRWALNKHDDVLNFLKALLPYLIVKHIQAKTAISFLEEKYGKH